MRRKLFGENSIYFLVLVVSIVCGIIVGAATATLINDESAKTISSMSAINADSSTEYSFNIAYNILKYPLIIFFLGFTPFGVALIPLVTGIKGYFLSFTIGAIIKIYGISGMALSASVFGIQSIVLLPCLIIMATQSLRCATYQVKILFRGQKSISGRVFTKSFFVVSGICFITLLFLILIEIYISPHLITRAFDCI